MGNLRNYIIIFSLLIAIHSQQLSAQNRDELRTLKYCKTLNLSAGFLDLALGAELRADLPVNKLMLSGAFGYISSPGLDTVFIPPVTSVSNGGGSGYFAKIGVGYKISRKNFVVKEKYKILTLNEYLYFFNTGDRRYYTRDPSYFSKNENFLMVNILRLPDGKFVQAVSKTGRKVSLFTEGYNDYFMLSFRHMRQSFSNADRLTIIIADLSVLFTKDLYQRGIYGEISGIRKPLNVTFGFGGIKRNDVPSNFGQYIFENEEPDDYAWHIQLRATIGYSFVTKVRK